MAFRYDFYHKLTIFALNFNPLSDAVEVSSNGINAVVTRKRLFSESCHFWHLQAFLTNITSVCAKLEPASFKNNEMLKINVLQKFTPDALCQKCQTVS